MCSIYAGIHAQTANVDLSRWRTPLDRSCHPPPIQTKVGQRQAMGEPAGSTNWISHIIYTANKYLTKVADFSLMRYRWQKSVQFNIGGYTSQRSSHKLAASRYRVHGRHENSIGNNSLRYYTAEYFKPMFDVSVLRSSPKVNYWVCWREYWANEPCAAKTWEIVIQSEALYGYKVIRKSIKILTTIFCMSSLPFAKRSPKFPNVSPPTRAILLTSAFTCQFHSCR